MNKILIVEDDGVLCEELSILLQNSGYQTETIADFGQVLAQMKQSDADLILLDITLPGVNGEVLLQEYRKEKDTPVIMLTSRTGEIDEVLSMSYGADDYITKPYHPAILLLRISAVLRRGAKTGAVISYHDIRVHTARGSLSAGEREEMLTKNEMLIFRVLLDRQGEIVSRDELMTALWDNDEYLNDNALSVNISRLRAKLASLGLPDAIETRKKQGYLLQ
ncbi:MAG: response regulator transcription factor [Lachnospiraceae bacterium]|nr:response regulator transcription factor [Lachnospiraceae bacterium]